MSQISKLLKLQLDNKFVIFKQKSLKSFLQMLFKQLIIIASITLGLYFLFQKLAFYLGIKINAHFISIVILGAQAILFFFEIGNIISTLYLNKDNELLMVLPVTFNQLFISKILLIYITDLIFNILYILPIFLTMGIIGKLSITYFLMLILLIPLMPILPTALASIISIPMMFVIKYFKKHPLLSVLAILAIVSVVFVAYMSIISTMSGAINIAEKQIETSIRINNKVISIGKSIGVYLYLAQSLFNLKYVYIPFVFLVVGLLIMVGCLLLIKPFYYKIATISFENNVNNIGKYRSFKVRKPFWELVINEIRSVFRSPNYLFQYFLFPIFMPLIVYTYDKLLINIAVSQAGHSMIIGSHVLVLCLIALMSNTISSTAISREGGTFYIAKTTPVSPYVQVSAKIFFNAIFTLGAILITTITTLLFTDLSAWVVLFTSLNVMILSVGHICHSFDMDLRAPILDWYDNSEISSLGKSTSKSIIYALVLAILMCLIMVFGSSGGVYIACLIQLFVSIFYCYNRIRLLFIRTKYYYNLMEM